MFLMFTCLLSISCIQFLMILIPHYFALMKEMSFIN